LIGFSSSAQTTASNDFNHKIEKVAVAGAQLGSLACENSLGQRILCSGSVEETVLGIVTNVPYITINKPATADASRFIFDALISVENGNVVAGDHLVANSGGTLAKSADQKQQPYAIALQNADKNGIFRVKLLNR
jgi:hypothetical protein